MWWRMFAQKLKWWIMNLLLMIQSFQLLMSSHQRSSECHWGWQGIFHHMAYTCIIHYMLSFLGSRQNRIVCQWWIQVCALSGLSGAHRVCHQSYHRIGRVLDLVCYGLGPVARPLWNAFVTVVHSRCSPVGLVEKRSLDLFWLVDEHVLFGQFFLRFVDRCLPTAGWMRRGNGLNPLF